MLAAVQDDLDTPKALMALAELSDAGVVDPEKIQHLLNVIDRMFGLQLAERPDVTREQKGLIANREQAREAKDWKESDKLRDQLAKQGIAVRDTANGPIWSRI
jgi:cysteinyl-tRNA synthetase